MALVHHRNGHEAVLGHHLRDLLLARLGHLEGAHEREQRGVVQRREHLARAFWGEPPEERDLLVEGQTLEGRGNVRRMGRLERLLVPGILATLEQPLGGVEESVLIAHDHRLRRMPSPASSHGDPSGATLGPWTPTGPTPRRSWLVSRRRRRGSAAAS